MRFKFFLGASLIGALLLSCKGSRDLFRSKTEFGARLQSETTTKSSKPYLLNMLVEYPEEFRGDTLEAVISGGGKDSVVTLKSLQHKEKHICVGGDIVAVANSKGSRGRDDNGASAIIQAIRSAPTSTMITQNICTGQGEQLSCMPMTYPLETPGTESIVMHSERFPLRFKSGSVMIFQMSEVSCPANK